MHDDREVSLKDLFSRLPGEIGRIVRDNLALMRMEFKSRVKALKVDLILMAAGGFSLVLGVLALVATLIIALAYAMPAWLSALIVGLFFLIAGGATALVGLNRLGKTDWAPTETMEALKEEGTWLREKLA
jgi:hypothetical protein